MGKKNRNKRQQYGTQVNLYAILKRGKSIYKGGKTFIVTGWEKSRIKSNVVGKVFLFKVMIISLVIQPYKYAKNNH